MAPEQARGDRDLRPAVDIFALGCVIYRCLTGIQPFHAEHVPAMLTRILFEIPRPMSQIIAGLPPMLDELITRMLAKESAERLASADELLRALDGLSPLPDTKEPAEPDPALGIGRTEQRLISLILITLGSTPVPGQASAPAQEATAELPAARSAAPAAVETLSVDKLRDRLESFGAQVLSLVDGSLVATFHAANGLASDLAALAARCALSIREIAPKACIAVGTSRSALQSHGGFPAGHILEQFDPLLRINDSGTKEAAILLDEMTANLLDFRFDTERNSSGLRRLKGLHQELDANRKLLGKTTPCIGRESELGILNSHAQQCLIDSGAKALLVLGSPGIGKSRLRQEFLRCLHTELAQQEESAEIVLIRGDSMAMTSPYGLVRAALQQLCGLDGVANRAAKLQRLTEKLATRLLPSRLPHARDVLAELCDLHGDDAVSLKLRRARTDPGLMRQEVRAALCEFLSAECAAIPVILVIDDLQWADPLSVEVLGTVVQRLDAQPLFLLAFGRFEFRERFPYLWKDLALEVVLRGLGRKASGRLIREILGPDVPVEAVERMIDQAAGNALYLEELIRAYAAAGEDSGIPDTVLAMMQARLDRLPAEARRVLRAASVFGQVFWLPAVQHVLGPGQSPVELARQLDYLIECELCERHPSSRYAGSAEYAFCNQFIREAVYSLLTQEDRVRGHRLAGQYQAQAGDCEPRLLFDHLKRGGEYEQAVHYGLLAGDGARRLCSQEEARLIYAEVVELTEQLGDAAHQRMLRADALLRFTRCSLSIQSPEATAGLLDQVEELLPADASVGVTSAASSAAQGAQVTKSGQQNLQYLRAWLHCLRAQVAVFQSDNVAVTHHCRLTLTLGTADERLATPELVAFPAVALGATLLGQGYCAQAAVLFRQALAALENLNDLSEQIRAQVCLAASLIGQGESRAAWSTFREAELRAQETNQPSVLGTVYHIRAIMHLWVGDFSAALIDCNLAIRKATKSGEQVTLVQCTLTSILAAVQLGDTAGARKSIQAALTLSKRLGEKVLLGQWLTIAQAELAILDGNLADGLALAQLACEHSSRSDQPHCLGVAERVLARALAALHPERCTEIDAHLHRSITALDSAGLALEVARTQLHWALLLKRRQPEQQQASELYAAALMRFRTSECKQAMAEAERLWSATQGPSPAPLRRAGADALGSSGLVQDG